MKQILATILTMLFFTGCSTLNLSKISVDSKENLIQKAQNGNIHAMIELNKYYDFPKTKEGLYYFEKWYKNIDNKDNTKDIYEVANIYKKNQDMFINGKDRAVKLYKMAASRGNKEANLKIIDVLLDEYRKEEALEIENKIIDSLNEKQLQELCLAYKKNYYPKGAKRVAQYIEKKGFQLPFEYKLYKLQKLTYKKSQKNQFNTILLDEIINSKNSEHIYKMAKLLKRRYKFEQALFVYNKLLELEPNNAQAYYDMGYIYSKMRNKLTKEQREEKKLEYFAKAARLGNQEAASILLKNYSQSAEYMDKFFALQNDLEKTQEGRFSIAKYYLNKREYAKADELLNNLAEEGYHDAILKLALNTKSKYNFNPYSQKLLDKWKKYIHTSNDVELEKKYKEQLYKYRYKKRFKEELELYSKEDIKRGYIPTLRKFFTMNKYSKPEKAMKYIKIAVEAGDVKSTRDLAKYYMYNNKYRSFRKTASTLQTLVRRGDIEATRDLADLYLRPHTNFKKFKNVKKGLKYYEYLANKDDIQAIKKLAYVYTCGDCNNGETADYRKAFIYLQKLEKLNHHRSTATIGWLYNFGHGVEKDLYKAKEYYEKAAKNGYSPAYYYLAWLYYKDKESTIEPIRVDYTKAMEYLQKGAQRYNAKCINLIGVFYENGLGVEKDIEKAATYYKKAARYSPYASYHLAKYYIGKKEYDKAMKNFKMSARQGSAASMIEIGIMHEKGLLGKVDIEKAIESYKKAYKKSKDGKAAYNLALVYHYGKGGLEKNLEIAKKWYLKSNIDLAKKQLAKLNEKQKKKQN